MGGLFYEAGAKTDRDWSMDWLLSKLWQQQTLNNEAAHPTVRIAWPLLEWMSLLLSLQNRLKLKGAWLLYAIEGR